MLSGEWYVSARCAEEARRGTRYCLRRVDVVCDDGDVSSRPTSRKYPDPASPVPVLQCSVQSRSRSRSSSRVALPAYKVLDVECIVGSVAAMRQFYCCAGQKESCLITVGGRVVVDGRESVNTETQRQAARISAPLQSCTWT